MIYILNKNDNDRFSKRAREMGITFFEMGFHGGEGGFFDNRQSGYKMIFLIQGMNRLAVAGESYEARQNSVFIIPPYTEIEVLEGNSEFYWVRFSADDLDFFKLDDIFIRVKNPYRIESMLKEMLFITKSADYPKFAADILLTYLLCEISALRKKTGADNSMLIREVTGWICENINTDLTVLDVSHRFHFNKDYLGRIFKLEMGMSLKQFIISEQLKKAKFLLVNTKKSVKEISRQLGYQDENLFVKFFKYHEKHSPEQFRKQKM